MADKHKAAPMVDEVSEFEILEIAVRELAIEKGLFTQDDHNAWTDYMHTLSPVLQVITVIYVSWQTHQL